MVHTKRGGFKQVMGLLAASVFLFAVAGCGQSSASKNTESQSQSQQSANSDSQKSKTPDASESDTSDSSASASGSSAQNGRCASSQLSVSLGAGQGAGPGSAYPSLVFTNTGSTSCTTKGYPGVSLQAGGTQIGAAAERDSSVAATDITLKPGESAHAILKITQAAAFDASVCSPKQADSILVYPPDQKTSISVPTADYTGCAASQTSLLSVRVLEPGKA